MRREIGKGGGGGERAGVGRGREGEGRGRERKKKKRRKNMKKIPSTATIKLCSKGIEGGFAGFTDKMSLFGIKFIIFSCSGGFGSCYYYY